MIMFKDKEREPFQLANPRLKMGLSIRRELSSLEPYMHRAGSDIEGGIEGSA